MHVLIVLFVIFITLSGALVITGLMMNKNLNKWGNKVVVVLVLANMFIMTTLLDYAVKPHEVNAPIYKTGIDYILVSKHNKKKIITNYMLTQNKITDYYIPILDLYLIADNKEGVK